MFFYKLISNTFKIFVCKKSTIKQESIDNIQNSESEMKKILSFYENYSAKIEILKEGDLYEVYYIKLPYCIFQSKDHKKEFQENVNRTNSKTKCENLVRSSKILLITLRLDYKLRYTIGNIVGLLVENQELWSNYVTVIAFILNIYMLITYNESLESSGREASISSFDTNHTLPALTILGFINFIFVLIISFIKFFIRIPYNYQHYKLQRKGKAKSSIEEYPSNSAFMGIFDINNYTLIRMIFTDIVIFYHLTLLLFSLLGLLLHPFFYAFLLTYIITRSSILLKVLRAVYEPLKEILWTLALLLMVTYFFTILSYYVFHNYYEDELKGSCYSLFGCLIVTLDATYKFDGAVGGWLGQPFDADDDGDINIDWDRFIFDYLFNLVIAVLIIQILSGIIIDKFSELREQLEEKQKDCKSQCFICGQSREEFEKKLGYDGFEIHTKYEHNMWDYLFFIGYLRHKKSSYASDFSEIERYVFNKLGKDDITWMPCYYDYQAHQQEDSIGFKDDDRILLQKILIDLKTLKMDSNSDRDSDSD